MRLTGIGMVIMSLTLLFALSAVCNSTEGLASPTEYYQVETPADHRSCELAAQDLAQKFTRLSGVVPERWECLGVVKIEEGGKTYNIYNLELAYHVPNSRPNWEISSSFFGFSYTHQLGKKDEGYFKTYTDCLDELPHRTEEFSQNTGYETLAATCEPAEYTSELSYNLRMDVIGDPAVKLFSVSNLRDVYSGRSFASEISKMIRFRDGKVVAQDHKAIYYYSKNRVDPSRVSIAKVASANCWDQISELMDIVQFENISPHETSVICYEPWAVDPRKKPKDVYVELLMNGFWSPNVVRMGHRYTSYIDCKGDKVAMLKKIKRSSPNPAVAICTQDMALADPNFYVMDIYSPSRVSLRSPNWAR